MNVTAPLLVWDKLAVESVELSGGLVWVAAGESERRCVAVWGVVARPHLLAGRNI